MNDDFDQTIGRLLNQSVDAQLGPRRPAPPFQLEPATATARGRSPRRGARPWIMPLVAAACVVAAAVATIGASQALAHRHPAPPASQQPQPPVTTSSVPSSPTPSATAARTSKATRHPSSSRSAPAGLGVTVTLGTAVLKLPAGWVARDYAQYLPANSGTLDQQAWCLTPSTTPASTAQGACPVRFGIIAPKAASSLVDVDNEGGYAGNSEYCSPSGGFNQTVDAADRAFGDRPADYRHWTINCKNGKIWQIEQYVVASDPGYILFSEQATPALSAQLATIAHDASVPARTSAVRFYDFGYVRAVLPVAGGYRVSVDRAVPTTPGYLNSNPATYDYLIPTALYQAARTKPTVGKLITIYTNGSVVTTFSSG